ncbi:MAG TPA: hypothetical protein VF455_09185 [Chryseobacterium sp.]
MSNIRYYNLDSSELFSLAKFVVEENYNHHQCNHIQLIDNEVSEMCHEEKKLSNSTIFVARDGNYLITGSIRVTRWNYKDTLPTEKLFNINPQEKVFRNLNIWHIGRFAVKQGADKKGFIIFKTLMTLAINQVCSQENSAVLAECDVKLLRTLKLLGFEVVTLSESINYLGSETVPVLFSFSGLKKFLDKNAYLIKENPIQKNRVMSYKKAI